MRRLSRRLSERTRLKSVASLLVGVGLATGMMGAQAISLVTPGTTTYVNELFAAEPIDIGAQHTLVLDSRNGFGLYGTLNNRGVVRIIGTGPTEWGESVFYAFDGQINQGRWILESADVAVLATMQNTAGVIEIGTNSRLMVDLTGGRIQGTDASSLIRDSGLRDATLAGRLNTTSVSIAGTLNIEGQVSFSNAFASEATTLKGSGQTLLRGATGAFQPAPTALTIAAGHRVDAAGQLSRIALTNQGQLLVAQQQTLTTESLLVQQVDEARLVVKGNLQTPGIQIQAGVLDLHNTSYVTGDVDLQAGRLMLHQFSGVEPGSLGLGAIIEGNLTLSDQSTVEVIVDHDGDHFATLEIWGNASLGGDLIVSFVDGVKVPSTFDILFMGSNVQGSFRSLRVNGSGNLPWTFVQNSNGQVSIAAVPEPGTWGLMLCGLGVVGWHLRRRAATQTAR